MFRAVNAMGNSVLASRAVASETYYCPLCHQALNLRHGSVRAPHFAHKASSDNETVTRCSDGWAHDKSEWHIDWQLRFPEEFYEKMVEHNGKRHIADIATDQNLIVEFQHSAISIDEFRERNSFYTACGYRVVWVFDFIEECDTQKVWNEKGNEFHWSHVRKPFQDVDIKAEQCAIYVQLSDNEDNETGVLERLTGIYKSGTLFYADAGRSLSKAEFLNAAIEKPDILFPRQRYLPDNPQVKKVAHGRTIVELWQKNYKYMI